MSTRLWEINLVHRARQVGAANYTVGAAAFLLIEEKGGTLLFLKRSHRSDLCR